MTLRIGYGQTLTVSPNPALAGQDITFSGQAGSGDSMNIDGFSGSCAGAGGLLLGSFGTGTADSGGAYSITKTGGLASGSYSAIANDFTSQTNSGCVDFTVNKAPLPVGGFIESVDPLATFGPWLATIGLVGCLVVVAVARKRRP